MNKFAITGARMGLIALALATTQLASSTAEAGINSKVSLEKRTKEADHVSFGTIESMTAEKETNQWGDELIVTRAKVKVDEHFKGENFIGGDSTVELTVEGGSFDGLTMKVSDQPELKGGDKYVMFLSAADGRNKPLQRSLGLMKIGKNNRLEDGMKLSEARRRIKHASRVKR